jgi:ribosomal protein S27AE
MERLALEGKLGPDIEVDLCFACHVLWLDRRESLQLSPGGTLDLFKALNDHRDDPRHAIGESNSCPRCGAGLRLMHDIGKGGRFSYHRCPSAHGRLTPFSEFLKEKEFVRSLTPLEQKQLAAEVKQVQCSSCGAPVELSKGFACGHCGSALTVLDPEAVGRTLKELDQADAARKSVPPEVAEARARAKAALENLRRERPEPHGRSDSFRVTFGGSGWKGGRTQDLLSASINLLFRTLG